ncbi:MAG: class I SAM-dependent methyltransferase [Bacteroidetes bacterium]|nr:class I SAM-dependent methyltransferase [Bacteroidota bacterium]
MRQRCLFCHSDNYSSSFLPDTFFNNKHFRYITCNNCQLVYLDPLPVQEDFEAIYQPSYQSGINNIIFDRNKKPEGLRFPYSRHFAVISKYAPGKKILDYGCGQGNFVINAVHAGFRCDGVEYNPVHIGILKKEIVNSNFYLPEIFFKTGNDVYDIIRLSNVLEHLPNPTQTLSDLIDKLNRGGILLIEGPIETNFNVAFLIRKIYFNISKFLFKNRVAFHPPTHLFFSNAFNQRKFLGNLRLEEIQFEICENAWPFPEKWKDVTGIGSAVKYLIAQFSLFLSLFNKNLGNTFLYVGRKS